MHEPAQPESGDLKALWRAQPQAHTELPEPEVIERRSRQMSAITRSEILSSLGAALFFAAVIALRLGSSRIVAFSVAIVAVWIVLTLYTFRRRVWRRATHKDPQTLTSSGLDFYRTELQQRRKHLVNEWLWHGPLLLGCVTVAAVALGSFTPSVRSLVQVAPVVVALLAWTVISIRRRRREADEIRRELDELANA